MKLKSSIVTVCALIAGWVQAQQRCPSNLGWYKFEDNCYRFEAFPRRSMTSALSACEQDGASLVSINSLKEHTFVQKWLLENDMRRIDWVTSGLTTLTGVQWQADSTTSVVSYWVDNPTVANQTGVPVVYHYTGTEYGWDRGSGTTQYAFICEIPLNEVYKISQEYRDFDYGLDVENAMDAPRGPMFLKEPQDTAILGSVRSISLECLADGNPEPSYEWLMKKNDRWVKIPSGGRYSTVTGKLEINNPSKTTDQNTYQCKASNSIGTVLSSFSTLSFGELGDFSNLRPAKVTGAEYDGAQLECPEINGKPAKTYQWYKDSITNFIRPNYQKHSFLSMNGKLYFSELAQSDVGTYYCMVNLYSYGFGGQTVSVSSESRISNGFELEVTSGGGSQYQPTILNEFPYVFPPSPVKGGNVQLECFAYGTGPLIYSWSRADGKPLPLGHRLDSNNRVLILPQVELQDSGVYKCYVTSTATGQDDWAQTNLIIQARPYFTYPLSHMHLDKGARLSWHCEAAGMPEPVYSWFKDGQPLSSIPSGGLKIDRNSLTIESVDKSNNGMYQCAAANRYGTTFSTAQLRVLEFPPSFDKRPMTKTMSAARGGDATILCSPVAAPTPEYRWLKDGSDLNLDPNAPDGAHYTLLRNGNLVISGVTDSDQGRYMCSVKNDNGEDSDYTDLLVLQGTVISQGPSDEKLEVNLTATLLCSASHSPEIDMIYLWKFNDHIIDYRLKPEYRRGEGNLEGALHIVAVQFKHEGKYTCTAMTSMDSFSTSAYFTVLGPPGEPAGVTVRTTPTLGSGAGTSMVDPNQPDLNPETTRWVVWMDGQDHFNDITHYFIEFRTEFDPRWRVHPDGNNVPKYKVTKEISSKQRIIALTDLKAFAGIEFRVRARNSFGIGVPSQPTDVTQIPGTLPTAKVSNIRGGGGSVGDLTIVWDPLPREDHNGPDLQYIVSWREYNKNQDDGQWRDITIKEAYACKYRVDYRQVKVFPCDHVAYVTAANFYKPYEIVIRVKNFYGEGPSTDPVIIMSAEDLPVGAPENVHGHWYNATALLITWKSVPNTREAVRGRLKGYKVNYWRRDEDKETDALQNIIELKPGQENLDQALIIGLEPVKWYRFNVQAYNTAGNGDKSSTNRRQTLNKVPGNFPTEVHVFSVEGFGVRVNFRGISTQVREEPLKGYRVQYWKANENIHGAQIADFGKMTTGVIRNLSSSEIYQLRVYGYSRAGQGQRSSPSIYFTVGDGQIVVNPETTEILSGSSTLTVSLVLCVCALAIALLGRIE